MTAQEVKAKLDSFRGKVLALLEVEEAIARYGEIAIYYPSARLDGMPRSMSTSSPVERQAINGANLEHKKNLCLRRLQEDIDEVNSLIYYASERNWGIMLAYYINGKTDVKIAETKNYTKSGITRIRLRELKRISESVTQITS